MDTYGWPAAYALFVWWFSTGLIIYLNNLPRHTFRWSMLGGTIVLAMSLHRLEIGAWDVSTRGAYAAFTYGVLVWGWQEMSFFMGYATGPRRTPCPPDAEGWRRFRYGVEACLYHELAIIASAALVVAASWGAPNQVGVWTFMALWGMRQAAKLNVFLGVRNLAEEFLPTHVAYLGSYFRRAPMNWLFPFSVTGGSIVTVWLYGQATAPGVSEFRASGLTFIVTMLGLAVIELWFLVLPIPFAEIWGWFLKVSGKGQPAPDEAPAALPAPALRRLVHRGG